MRFSLLFNVCTEFGHCAAVREIKTDLLMNEWAPFVRACARAATSAAIVFFLLFDE